VRRLASSFWFLPGEGADDPTRRAREERIDTIEDDAEAEQHQDRREAAAAGRSWPLGNGGQFVDAGHHQQHLHRILAEREIFPVIANVADPLAAAARELVAKINVTPVGAPQL